MQNNSNNNHTSANNSIKQVNKLDNVYGNIEDLYIANKENQEDKKNYVPKQQRLRQQPSFTQTNKENVVLPDRYEFEQRHHRQPSPSNTSMHSNTLAYDGCMGNISVNYMGERGNEYNNVMLPQQQHNTTQTLQSNNIPVCNNSRLVSNECVSQTQQHNIFMPENVEQILITNNNNLNSLCDINKLNNCSMYQNNLTNEDGITESVVDREWNQSNAIINCSNFNYVENHSRTANIFLTNQNRVISAVTNNVPKSNCNVISSSNPNRKVNSQHNSALIQPIHTMLLHSDIHNHNQICEIETVNGGNTSKNPNEILCISNNPNVNNPNALTVKANVNYEIIIENPSEIQIFEARHVKSEYTNNYNSNSSNDTMSNFTNPMDNTDLIISEGISVESQAIGQNDEKLSSAIKSSLSSSSSSQSSTSKNKYANEVTSISREKRRKDRRDRRQGRSRSAQPNTSQVQVHQSGITVNRLSAQRNSSDNSFTDILPDIVNNNLPPPYSALQLSSLPNVPSIVSTVPVAENSRYFSLPIVRR